MGFSRPEYWSGLPFPSPGDFPDPGIEPGSPSLQADSLASEPPDLVIGRVYPYRLGKAVLCSESCPERQKGRGFFPGGTGLREGQPRVSSAGLQFLLGVCLRTQHPAFSDGLCLTEGVETARPDG